MGTPGDKTKISKVVTTPVDPEEANLPVSPVSLPIDSSTSTMGVISRLPHFETIAASNIFPSVPQSVSKPDVLQLGVEQGQIDYYYTHSKYYPSVSETPPPVYPPATVKSQKTFPVNIDEPGPSGIQTPKTKPSASLLKVKKNKKPVSSPATPKKTYTCPICQKNYASSEKLIKHQQTHTFSSPFKCENCKKVFTSKFKLVRHKLIHSDSKPFVCTVCERTFHRKDHLKNHFKVHSPCKEIYVCEKPNCKKEYTSLLSYRKHLAIHEAEEGNLQCQICQYVSKSKEDIIFHLKRHAGSRTVKNPNEKKYTCDQCDRKFFTKKDVRRHLVVHTGMRDFLCQFCPQRFGRKDHLVRHIKKSHNKKFLSEETSVVKVEKKDLPQTVTSSENLKLEIKSEGDTSSVSNPADFALDYFQNVGTMFDESLLFQSPSSTQTELRDLGPILEEEIASTSTDPSMLLVDNFDVPNQNVLNESDLARLLDSTEDVNTPLPPFSKTFQPPNA